MWVSCLRQIWETADLSTALRSGRDDKLDVVANLGFFKPIFIPWVGRRPIQKADSLRE